MEIRAMIERFEPQCEQEVQDKRMMLSYMDRFGDLLFRSNETAHFTASGWIVNPARTQVLMAYHNIYDSWAWTGGHADGEADLAAVALREAQEETGLQRIETASRNPISLEILPVAAHYKRGKYVVAHLHLNLTFLFVADDAQPVRNKPDENRAVRWFALEQAVAASTEPDMRSIYEKLNRRINLEG